MFRRSWVSARASLAASWNGTAGLVGKASTLIGRSLLVVLRSTPGSRRGGSAPTPALWRCRPPPMCIRHELSAETQTSARVSSTQRILSPSIAIDVSAFFTANVPPNPQHSSALGSSTRSIPRTARSSLSGASPTRSIRKRVAGRMIGDPMGVIRPDVLDAQLVDQELGQLEDLRRDRERPHRASFGSPASSAAWGYMWRTIPTHEAEGRDDDLGRLEDLDEPADQRDRLALKAGVVVHLAAAGLVHRELDRVPEPLEQADHGPAGLGEDRVVEAGDEQGNPHASLRPFVAPAGVREAFPRVIRKSARSETKPTGPIIAERPGLGIPLQGRSLRQDRPLHQNTSNYPIAINYEIVQVALAAIRFKRMAEWVWGLDEPGPVPSHLVGQLLSDAVGIRTARSDR